MKCNEAVILAGGFGTRLQSVVSDVPKPMAKVGEYPFLHYVLNHLKNNGIKKIVLSVGYRHETIIKYFGSKFGNVELTYAIENQPLGTGGAVKFAAQYITTDKFFLLNGDSIFKSDLSLLEDFHEQKQSQITLSLKEMQHFDRYGSVQINHKGQITTFREKQYCKAGLINTGVYMVDKQSIIHIDRDKFSFEKDILEQQLENQTIYGTISEGYFIDIGIPEDYSKANNNIHMLL